MTTQHLLLVLSHSSSSKILVNPSFCIFPCLISLFSTWRPCVVLYSVNITTCDCSRWRCCGKTSDWSADLCICWVYLWLLIAVNRCFQVAEVVSAAENKFNTSVASFLCISSGNVWRLFVFSAWCRARPRLIYNLCVIYMHVPRAFVCI